MASTIRQAGIYKGIIIDNNDPAGYNRVKVRILEFHGTMDKNAYGSLNYDTTKKVFWVDDADLPWAEVCYPYGTLTKPEINQVVWVTFYGANAQYPVVIGWTGYEYIYEEEVYESP